MEKAGRIYIRADANETIGTGHVMRCLSIAEELCSRGAEAVFVTADRQGWGRISGKGFKTVCLDSGWNSLDEETGKLIRLIKHNPASLLLADSYYVTETYLREIGQYIKTAYIDDLDRFIYPVDLLVNYNFYGESLHYQERYRDKGLKTRFALGCRYVPLRKEFSGVHRTINSRASRILLATGGTDQYNAAGSMLEAFSAQPWFKEMEYHVIIGRFNRNRESLEKKWEGCQNVCFHADVADMAAYMIKCDLAVTAGGVTSYELCACGTPSIMYTLADNQLGIAKAVSQSGLMPWAGDVREDMEKCTAAVMEYAGLLRNKADIRREASRQMQTAVDGRGCGRLADIIMQTGGR